MNIWSKPGATVIFANPNAGYPHHQETAAKHLKEGWIYTVERTEVGGWHTDVFLKEIPNVPFNSVMFDNYLPDSEGIREILDTVNFDIGDDRDSFQDLIQTLYEGNAGSWFVAECVEVSAATAQRWADGTGCPHQSVRPVTAKLLREALETQLQKEVTA